MSPVNRDMTFDSSRLLAYKDYLLKYMRILDETKGVNTEGALDRLMREIEKDFPNDKVHPGDVIIAACALAWEYGQRTNRPATATVLRIVRTWKGTGHRSMQREALRDDDAIRSGKLVLPKGVAIPTRRN